LVDTPRPPHVPDNRGLTQAGRPAVAPPAVGRALETTMRTDNTIPRPDDRHGAGRTSAPEFYEQHQALERLKLWKYELQGLLDLGIIAPVGRSDRGRPLFSAEAVERLASQEQRSRIRDALWWDFEAHLDRKDHSGRPWSPPIHLPFYPFDDEAQHGWARKLYTWKKESAPFPHRHGASVERFRRQAEDKATDAFEKAHGAKRRRSQIDIRVRGRPLTISRQKLRDLVWRKPMIQAAADLRMSEFALRQICKTLLIPTPSRGHFNHKNPKDRAPRPALPPLRKKETSAGVTPGTKCVSVTRSDGNG
jgi:hypothetical protein